MKLQGLVHWCEHFSSPLHDPFYFHINKCAFQHFNLSSIYLSVQVRYFVPKLTALVPLLLWYMACSYLVIRTNSYDSVRLAIPIKSSALAVCANIISYTLKAPIITEQEPLCRLANTRVWLKISHVWTRKEISIGWQPRISFGEWLK